MIFIYIWISKAFFLVAIGREALFLANLIPEDTRYSSFKSQKEENMRTTLTFNSNLESLSDYMTRVAEGLRSIRDDVYTSWGVQRC